jgi:CrcB protein
VLTEIAMPWTGILAVGGGAAIGAWLRWGLGIALNPVFPTLPLGTLTANLVGGLLMGVAMEFITRHAVLSPAVQLLVTTGFLGGLTTFSTFSAEIVTLLLRKEYLWGTIAITAHVVGSIAMTIVGILLARAFYGWGTA